LPPRLRACGPVQPISLDEGPERATMRRVAEPWPWRGAGGTPMAQRALGQQRPGTIRGGGPPWVPGSGASPPRRARGPPAPLAAGRAAQRPGLTSHVTVISADGTSKRVVYSAPRRFEAPNWSPDGKYLLLNSDGRLWRLPLAGGEPELVDTGSVRGI